MPKPLGPGSHLLGLSVGGYRRRYLVHVPPQAREALLPVVLMLHGVGGSARWTLLETGWAGKADREGFVAVFPEGLPADPSRPARLRTNPYVWNTGLGQWSRRRTAVNDEEFLSAVLDDLPRRVSMDPARVLVTGFSSGAAMAFRLAAALSPRLTAVAPVAGYCPLERPRLEKPLSTAYLIGTADPLVPLEGGEAHSPWGGVLVRPAVWESLGKWAGALGCSPRPRLVRQEGDLREMVYDPGPAGAELLVYLIEGLGHHWPGGKGQWDEATAGKHKASPRATDLIWDFFKAHWPSRP